MKKRVKTFRKQYEKSSSVETLKRITKASERSGEWERETDEEEEEDGEEEAEYCKNWNTRELNELPTKSLI